MALDTSTDAANDRGGRFTRDRTAALTQQCHALNDDRAHLVQEVGDLEQEQIEMAREIAQLRLAGDASPVPVWSRLERELERVQRERVEALTRLDETTRQLIDALDAGTAAGADVRRIEAELMQERDARDAAERRTRELTERLKVAERQQARGRRRRLLGLLLAVLPALLVGAVAGALLFGGGDSAGGGAADPAPKAEATGPEPCKSVASGAATPIACATSSSLLTIVNGRELLDLPGSETRILDANADAATVTVRTRIRNTGSEPKDLFAGGRPYLRIGGSKVDAADPSGPVTIAPGESTVVSLTFAITPAQRRRLAAEGTEVGFLPYGEQTGPGGLKRIGVARLRPF